MSECLINFSELLSAYDWNGNYSEPSVVDHHWWDTPCADLLDTQKFGESDEFVELMLANDHQLFADQSLSTKKLDSESSRDANAVDDQLVCDLDETGVETIMADFDEKAFYDLVDASADPIDDSEMTEFGPLFDNQLEPKRVAGNEFLANIDKPVIEKSCMNSSDENAKQILVENDKEIKADVKSATTGQTRGRRSGRRRAKMTADEPNGEEDAKLEAKREKNRLAAKRCREKKMKEITDLEVAKRELMAENEAKMVEVCKWRKAVYDLKRKQLKSLIEMKIRSNLQQKKNH